MYQKQNLRRKTGLHMFASLEEKFLASCQNSHGTSQFKRTDGETKKKHHARLPAQVPASSVSRNPGGNNRQERKDVVSGQEDGKHREDYREGKHEHKKEKQCSLPQRAEAKGNGASGVQGTLFHARLAKRREGLGEQRLADFAILPHTVSWGFRA